MCNIHIHYIILYTIYTYYIYHISYTAYYSSMKMSMELIVILLYSVKPNTTLVAPSLGHHAPTGYFTH